MNRERNRSVVNKCIQKRKKHKNEELFKLRNSIHTDMWP